MNFKMKTIAALALAVVVVSCQAQTATTSKHKAKAKPAEVAAKPSVEVQIESLRKDLETQINGLKQQVADRDAKLAQAQQAAADAQAAASKAQAAADAQAATASENASSASALKATVEDLKGNQTSILTTIQDEQKKVTAAIENPTAIHYKGVTITPGGFVAAETVFRQKATGADLPTALNKPTFDGANSAALSEFYAGARQSRISALVEGKTKGVTYRGYTETDFLGVGTSSNNNQSNSYVLRERVFWAQAQFKSGFTLQAGQSWSLATERKKGLSNFSSDVETPLTIDPNYVPGFVWARQYGFAAIQNGKHVSYGVSLENAQTITGGSGCPAGSCTIGGSTAGVQSSSYNNLNGTYTYNLGPDIIAKVAVDPGWGHYEVFAIGRFPHYEYYPNYTLTGAAATAGRFTDSVPSGGFGGSLRAPVLGKYADFGVSGLYGQGVGRYGDSTIADVTFDAKGRMKALETGSALATLETHPTPRLTIYLNYGEDFVGRLNTLGAGAGAGYGLLTANNTGCNIESATPPTSTTPTNGAPASCAGNIKDVSEFVAGAWYDFYKGPAGRLRYGVQYGYLDTALWTGAAAGNGYSAPIPSNIANPHATNNQFYTSFRYYLP
jgi:hypothetical protein